MATTLHFHRLIIFHISIHALREEGDYLLSVVLKRNRISIHALREEGDTQLVRGAAAFQTFLSTPSARRATGSIRQQR